MINNGFKFLSWFFAFICLLPLLAFGNFASPNLVEKQIQLLDSGKRYVSQTKGQFFNIAHGTNLKESVALALRSGANALEMDLQFDEKNGSVPRTFHHGLPCECTCAPIVLIDEKIRDKRTASLCSKIASPCTKRTPVKELFQYIARHYSNKISFIYIDGKVSGFKDKALLKNAGRNIFNIVKEALFNKGYKGQIVFGVPHNNDIDYLTSIYQDLKLDENSAFLDRVFFTIDGEKNDAAGALNFMLDSGFTNNTIYSIGNSICTPKTHYANILGAYKYLSDGTIGLNIIWTLDRASSIKKYIKLGANAVISNSPKKVYEIATGLGYTISPENRISTKK